MAPRVAAVDPVFGTFVRIVASASAQNVFAHATSMLVCHRCRQLGPLTTNLNRGPMSRLLFLEASYRSCCRPALPNDSCGMVLYRGKNNHLESESNDSLLSSFSFTFSSLSLPLCPLPISRPNRGHLAFWRVRLRFRFSGTQKTIGYYSLLFLYSLSSPSIPPSSLILCPHLSLPSPPFVKFYPSIFLKYYLSFIPTNCGHFAD